jgi:hypothetical protein
VRDEVGRLALQYQQIEAEKGRQDRHMLELQELALNNVLVRTREAGVQVEEVGPPDQAELQWGVKSLLLPAPLDVDFTHLNDKVSALVANPVAAFEDPMLKVLANAPPPTPAGPGDAAGRGSAVGQAGEADRRRRKKPARQRQPAAGESPASITWQVPFGLCSFLQQVNQLYTEVSVVAWHKFRLEIFEVFDARLADDWEIVSSPTNAVVPFEEYVVLHFVKTTPHPRAAPLRLLEFVSSLRFYAARWRRAYLCAVLCNLVRRADLGVHDVYLQNYFLYLYAKIAALRDAFEHDDEGATFVAFDRLADVLATALEFLDADRYQMVVAGLELKARPVNGKAGFVDVDETMLACVDLFLEEYGRRCEAAKKAMRLQIVKRSALGIKFGEFAKVVDDACPQQTSLKHLSFAADLTKARAYVLYRQLCGTLKRVGRRHAAARRLLRPRPQAVRPRRALPALHRRNHAARLPFRGQPAEVARPAAGRQVAAAGTEA